MYDLTLTKDERKAIGWIGDRYSHGDDFREILEFSDQYDIVELEWDDDCDISFFLTESDARRVCDIIDEGLDFFGSDLCAKLHDFAGKVPRYLLIVYGGSANIEEPIILGAFDFSTALMTAKDHAAFGAIVNWWGVDGSGNPLRCEDYHRIEGEPI